MQHQSYKSPVAAVDNHHGPRQPAGPLISIVRSLNAWVRAHIWPNYPKSSPRPFPPRFKRGIPSPAPA